mmetsp:Transcript_18961/g.51535  ORF Transcript_18961/g.51535 Transcript_18961/m.51535 type:complete len:211 (-) Transcript_18961:137-769(-)
MDDRGVLGVPALALGHRGAIGVLPGVGIVEGGDGTCRLPTNGDPRGVEPPLRRVLPHEADSRARVLDGQNRRLRRPQVPSLVAGHHAVFHRDRDVAPRRQHVCRVALLLPCAVDEAPAVHEHHDRPRGSPVLRRREEDVHQQLDGLELVGVVGSPVHDAFHLLHPCALPRLLHEAVRGAPRQLHVWRRGRPRVREASKLAGGVAFGWRVW